MRWVWEVLSKEVSFDQRPEGSEGATKNGPGRGNLKDVYQEFNFCADEINFVGFCKMKSGIFLENYGSSIPLVLYSWTVREGE